MRQQRVSRTDVQRARRSRERRRSLREQPGLLRPVGPGGPDLDDDLLDRITQVIAEASRQRSAV